MPGFADLPSIPAIDLQAACRALYTRQSVRFDDAIAGLSRLRFATQSAAILSQYAPEKLAGLGATDLAEIMESPCEAYPVEAAAFTAVSKLFPIEDYMLEESLLNSDDGSLPCLVFMPQGWAYSYDDDLDTVVCDPDHYADTESLLVMAYYLSGRIDKEYWKLAALRFGWPERIPECVARNTSGRLDSERFLRLLSENGLDEFEIAFVIAWQNTGNTFLDYTYSDLCQMVITYSLENVQRAVSEWAEAQPMLAQYRQALEHFNADPAIPERLIVLFDSCMTYEIDTRPRTLVEMWGEAVEEDNDDDEDDLDDGIYSESDGVLIDPFYGPIGLQSGDSDD